MKSTLLLNASYTPLQVVSARKAIKLILQDKATIQDASPYEFKTAQGEILNVPYVARLNKEIRKSKNARTPRFSRRGMLYRDNFTCAYCGNYGDTIDHVIPSSQGGTTTFENCVTACKKCNHKKSNKSLKQMGWTLDRKLVTPSPYNTMLNHARNDDELFNAWIEYISWYDEAAQVEKLKRQKV